MDHRIEGEKVIFNRLLWPERAEREEAVDECGPRCELGESPFMPSGDSDFKHPETYSVFIPLYFWRRVELSAHTSNQKTRKKLFVT